MKLPYSEEAEQSVLGACFISKGAYIDVVDVLTPDTFYFEKHKTIFNAMGALEFKGRPIDLVTVTEELRNTKQIEGAGGISYVARLSDFTPSAANVMAYAKTVKTKYLRRKMWESAKEIAETALNEQEDIEGQASKAEELVFNATQGQENTVTAFEHLVFNRWEKLYKKKNKKEIMGLPTGLRDLDKAIGGMQNGDLIIVAARPSVGKTALAQQIGQNVASKLRKTVLLYSLEMSKEAIADRAVCGISEIDSQKLRSGYLGESEWETALGDAAMISSWPLYIDDDAGINSLKIKSRARRLKADKGLNLVIVDYLQLINDKPAHGQNRNELIGNTTKIMKSMAKELKLPVILLSQLNRTGEGQIPNLAMLRDSGEIEQTADLVLFIHSESRKDEIRDIIIAKNKNGPVGRVKLAFSPVYTRFSNLSLRSGG